MDASGQIVVLRGSAVFYLKYGSDRGEPVLKRDLAMIKAWGGNVVRIPITPGDFISMGADEYLQTYVDDLVRWAGELGLYAVVSWKAHGNPWERRGIEWQHLEMTTQESLEPIRAISTRYSKCDWVLYSLWNENPIMTWALFRNAMIPLVEVVAECDPGALVLVPGTNIATMMRFIPDKPIPYDNVVYVSDIYQGAWYGKPWWRDDAVQLLQAGYPLMIGEWGFGYPEVGENHTSTPEDFGEPFLDFCEEHGISWTSWQWTEQFEIPMFYDYERLLLTPFGETVRTYLGRYGSPTGFAEDLQPLDVAVEPMAAGEAGCLATDVLDGEYGGIPSTILLATEEGGWIFERWLGPVDRPHSKLVSAEVTGETVTAVFKASPMISVDWSSLPLLLDWRPDQRLSYGTWSEETGETSGTSGLAEEFGGTGWHVQSIRAALLPEGLAIEVAMCADDNVSDDPRVDHVISLGDSQRIQIRPGAGTVGFYGELGSDWWQPGALIQIEKSLYRVFIPSEVWRKYIDLERTTDPIRVELHVAYRGEVKHHFVWYPGYGNLSVQANGHGE